jgi:hypothetical protein
MEDILQDVDVEGLMQKEEQPTALNQIMQLFGQQPTHATNPLMLMKMKADSVKFLDEDERAAEEEENMQQGSVDKMKWGHISKICFKKTSCFVMKMAVGRFRKMCRKTGSAKVKKICGWVAHHKAFAFGMMLAKVEPWKFAIGRCWSPDASVAAGAKSQKAALLRGPQHPGVKRVTKVIHDAQDKLVRTETTTYSYGEDPREMIMVDDEEESPEGIVQSVPDVTVQTLGELVSTGGEGEIFM